MSVLEEENLNGVKEARLINVIDGDTVDMVVNMGMGIQIKARIRLQGIDAPEIYGVKRTSEEYLKGMKARTEVVLWFEKGSGVFYILCSHKGIYGRWLGEIWREIGEISLNDWLMENYYKSEYWEKHSQEALIKDWMEEKDWKRWSEYGYALYGARNYSIKEGGYWGQGRYGVDKYINVHEEYRKGIYGVYRFNDSVYN